jgi:hypothetical protein
MSERGHRFPSKAGKVALRLLIAEFFISCAELPPCLYRVKSSENKMMPDGKTKSLLPSIADVLGMTDKRATDLLLACGLMKFHNKAKKLAMDYNGWTTLQSEFGRNGLDIQVDTLTHSKLLGNSKIRIVRLGHVKDKNLFKMKTFLEDIHNNTYTIPRMRFTARQTALNMDIAAHMPIQRGEYGYESEPEAVASASAPAVAAPMTSIRVPKSGNLESCDHQFQQSNFIPKLLNAISDKDTSEDRAAFWIFMSIGKKHPKAFHMAANSFGFTPPAPPKRPKLKPAVIGLLQEKRKPESTPARVDKRAKHLEEEKDVARGGPNFSTADDPAMKAAARSYALGLSGSSNTNNKQNSKTPAQRPIERASESGIYKGTK